MGRHGLGASVWRQFTLKIPDIYERLGLQDPDEFARERRNARLGSVMFVHEHLIEEYLARGTGRTTRMLAAALRDMSAGEHVLIIGKTFGYTRHLHDDLTRWAQAFRLRPELIASCPWNRMQAYSAFRSMASEGYSIHIDHFVLEDRDANRFAANHGW